MPVVLRRVLLWTLVCTVSAAPSFIVAANGFHRGAMVLGVCLFILGYTAATSTEAFERFHRRPFMRRTLYIGYGGRMVLSVLFPIGMGVDMFPGMLSVSFVRNVLQLTPESFLGTLATTCVQGTLLNLILVVFMSVVQAFQRAFLRPPEEPRGFAVLMPAQPVEVAPAAAQAPVRVHPE